MKKMISVLCAIIFLLLSLSVPTLASTQADVSNIAAKFNSYMDTTYDANGSGKLDAGDAREALLCSAGLKNKATLENADMDKDGVVTAIDARTLLRLAAKLDDPNPYYPDSLKVDYFNAIINSVKTTRTDNTKYKFYKMEKSYVDDVQYDNQALVDDMNSQLNKWTEMMGEEFNMGEEIRADVHKTTYATSTSILRDDRYRVTNTNYPIKGSAISSLLETNNIVGIDYKTNQTFTYEHYSASSKGTTLVYKEAVPGLDSLTVYLKSDSFQNLADIPADLTTMNNGKVLDVFSAEDINVMLASDALGNLKDMSDLGTYDIELGLNHIKYYDSSVTIYFDHTTGAPVGTVHNMHYDISLKTTINIDFNINNMEGIEDLPEWVLKLIAGDGRILYIKDGVLNITNTMTDTITSYFYENTTGHVPYNVYIQNH